MRSFAFVFFLILYGMAASAQPKYELIEVKTSGSCVDYQLVDSSGAAFNIPSSVKDGLICPSLLSLNGDTLIYRTGNSVRIFHISSGLDYKLFEVFDDVDGVSGPVWSPSHRRIGFIIINQQRSHGYNDFCRIIILDLNSDFKVIGKHKFDRPVNFSCGSICSSDAGTDFRFLDENNFEYIRNINIEDRPAEKGYIFIEN